jgi:hypothetical protein
LLVVFRPPPLEAEMHLVPAVDERSKNPLEVAEQARVPHHEQNPQSPPGRVRAFRVP